ncbi:MAG: zinc-binding dehydrogenase [Verrucomicrobiae bacterium]|nr:zinc-binding dehydrogenase [Verrucomicrobiae bacterium]
MKVLQYLEQGRPELVDLPIPEPGEGQVLIKVAAVATCPHWDLHIMDGVSMVPGGTVEYPYMPGQPGHEATGEVVKCGPGDPGLAVGTKVAFWRDQAGAKQGCYAEYVIADPSNLLEIPATLEPQEIASLELAMCVQVSFDQILNVKPIAGSRFAVSGLGPAGLLAIQLAKANGAREVIGFDPVESRRNLAADLGADRVLDPTDPESFPHDRFSPEAIDLAVDCTGLKVSVEYLMHRTRDVVALFGVLRDNVNFGFLHWCRGLHLIGYGSQNRRAAETALAHIVAGRLKLAPLMTTTLPLERYAEGVELLRKQQAIKVCFIP